MQIRNSTIVLTGATGGIGSSLARAFAGAGARMILVGREPAQLNLLCSALPAASRPHLSLPADLLAEDGRQRLHDLCAEQDIDMLVNNAGMSDFNLLENTDPAALASVISLNLTVPVLLTQLLLPLLRSRESSAVINVGSAFGSIGYPGFSVYCASKFGLRGFSEALRRELADTGVRVMHVAPRATRTALNTHEIMAMNQALGNAMDEPQQVARFIVQRVLNERWGHCVIGWPERLYAWVNAVFPALTDGTLRKQLPVIKKFAAPLSVASARVSHSDLPGENV